MGDDAGMSAPRLLHIFPGFGPSGTQLRMVTILNALGPRYSHEILALDGNYDAAAQLEPGLPWTQAAAARPGAWSSGELRRLLRAKRPGMVLTYNWGAFDGILAAILPTRLCPVIHNECGFGPDEAARRIPRRQWARRLVLPRVYRTVTVSSAIEQIALSEFGVPPARLVRITTGVDIRRFRSGEAGDRRRSWGCDAEALVYGYVGGLRPEKDVETMVRAFHAAALPEARLVLVGDGPDRPRLEALAGQLGIAGRVVFAGASADPAGCYRAFDVFVLSSATEGLPNAVLEAMATGLPVLCTAVGDCPRLLDNGAPECTVPPRDWEALGAAMSRLARSPERRARLGLDNRARVESHYSLEAMVAAYDRLWTAALSGR